MRQARLFPLSDHLKRLSALGGLLEELPRIVDFKVFRKASRVIWRREHLARSFVPYRS